MEQLGLRGDPLLLSATSCLYPLPCTCPCPRPCHITPQQVSASSFGQLSLQVFARCGLRIFFQIKLESLNLCAWPASPSFTRSWPAWIYLICCGVGVGGCGGGGDRSKPAQRIIIFHIQLEATRDRPSTGSLAGSNKNKKKKKKDNWLLTYIPEKRIYQRPQTSWPRCDVRLCPALALAWAGDALMNEKASPAL